MSHLAIQKRFQSSDGFAIGAVERKRRPKLVGKPVGITNPDGVRRYPDAIARRTPAERRRRFSVVQSYGASCNLQTTGHVATSKVEPNSCRLDIHAEMPEQFGEVIPLPFKRIQDQQMIRPVESHRAPMDNASLPVTIMPRQ